MSESTRASTSHEEILEEARERFARCLDDDSENRNNAREDFHFVYTPGRQWADDVRMMRKGWDEPCLEFNQLKQFVHQVVNDQRQNRPGIRIHPAGGQASEDRAEILQGMIRGIEYASKAESVYDTGYQSAVVGGRGWWRICTEYASPDSFEQVICLKAIADPNTVIADTNYLEPDGCDRRYVFVVEAVAKDEFTRLYPDADPLSFEDLDSRWRDGDSIIVADYYRRVCKQRTFVLMSDGAQGYKDEMPKPPAGVTIVRERDVEVWSVEWHKIAGGGQVLATYEIPGEYIPVICCPGDEIIIDGKRDYQGLIRHARDPQRMLNYGMTQQAIHLALSPRAPWIAAVGQIEGLGDIWRNANKQNFSVLPYKPVTIEGIAVPPPQRTQPSMPDAGWLNWTQQQLGMIKSTIGMYESSLGQRSDEKSGRAILARERQGDTATFHYVDNLSRAIALTGRIILDWIPQYYDTERIVSVIGFDGVRKMVTINQVSVNEALEAIRLNDVTQGDYAVTVEAGPSYATKRQESADKLSELVRAYPPMMQVAGDLVVRAQDIPDAEELAKRLKLTLPPPIQQSLAAQEKGQRAPDPQIMQAMMQKDQQLQQLGQAMQEAQAELQKLKSGVTEKMAAAQMEAQIRTQQMQADVEAQMRRAQTDAELAIQKANIEAQTVLQRAAMEQETAIRKAMIERMTKLQIAEMQETPEQEAAESMAVQIMERQEGIE